MLYLLSDRNQVEFLGNSSSFPFSGFCINILFVIFLMLIYRFGMTNIIIFVIL